MTLAVMFAGPASSTCTLVRFPEAPSVQVTTMRARGTPLPNSVRMAVGAVKVPPKGCPPAF